MLHFIHEGMGFDHWVFGPSFPSFLSPYHLSLRYVLSLKTTLRPWHHTLCLIALMWAILGIDLGAFWSWWTMSYGMALHWGIAISESFFPDDHYVEAYFSQSMMDFWAMFIPRRILDVLFHIGAWDMIGTFHLVYFTQGHTFFSRWWFFFKHSCSLETIRFISHWSTGYDWVIYLMWS